MAQGEYLRDQVAQNPDQILKPRARALGVLTFLLIIAVVSSFAWYFLVTRPNLGPVRESERLDPAHVAVVDEGAFPVDPVQGS